MISFRHAARRRTAVVASAALLAAGLTTGLALAAPTAAQAAAGHLGDATAFWADGDTYTIASGPARLRVTFEDDDLFRVEVAPDGDFTDPANDDPADPDAPDADIVVKRDYPGGHSTATETGDAYVISTDRAVLTITKSPITLRLTDADGRELMQETAPLAWSDAGTVQTLDRGADEQFFGGGMQNGRFSHRGQTIEIARNYDWDDGGNPNAVPFYLSSRGYGVLRDTFAPGSYDFGAPVQTTHREQRFDAYYFVGSPRRVIDGYTELTGRPAMLPMYALELGDADCYLHNANRGERHTLADSQAIADGYRSRGIPLGWMLVNDGYGCGYEDLPETGDMLHEHGAELGLWTQSDLTDQPYEVRSGVRVRKTDVAWVGPGYRFALDACEQAHDGIEDNSADRGVVMTIEGWAGTQRCAAMWSGDQSGSWDYIRWQVPTYAGSTMSGQHVTTGDVDGIFGGSAETYVRDLQWKMFLPMTYAMSGWAASDKQPWRYGDPYTDINKRYLLLHERLLPYFYTHLAEAHRTGLGSTRPLFLDYPEDPNTWGEKVAQEFLAGDDFLVAPVSEDTDERDGIYLPAGTWVDYWTGRVYDGGQTIDGYHAPLDTLPLFVRAGAVVPMFPEGTTDWQQGKQSGRLDLDVYPQGSSSFTGYEDDGRTRAYEEGAFATQRFQVDAPQRGRGPVVVRIGALDGRYDGMPSTRTYGLTVHTDAEPGSVLVDGQPVPRVAGPSAAPDSGGWWFDSEAGTVGIVTDDTSTGAPVTVQLNGAAAVGGVDPQTRNAELEVAAPTISTAGQQAEVTAAFTNDTGQPVRVEEVRLTAPDGWDVDALTATSADALAPGETFEARFAVVPPADADPGSHELAGTATYRAGSVSHTVGDRTTTTLAYARLADAFDNVGVTAAADPAPGDIDGGGSSFLAERLAEKGLTPGAAVDLNGFTFTWPDVAPGTPDNVASTGQTIAVGGEGNALAFLGTGTSAAAAGTATLHYADGTSESMTLGFPNWCCLPTDRYGAKIAVETLGKNTPSGPAYPTVEYRLYTKTLPVDPEKRLVAVTLPSNAAVHVFAMARGEEEVVPPPIPDGQFAITNAGGGGNLSAPGNTNAGQLSLAAASSSASQKWRITRHDDDGSYQIQNAGSGLCVDVAGSSQTSGAQVVQYTCTGTSNQRWVVLNADGRLTLKAQHSGLSLSANADGLVVQATDTGGERQRWTLAPG